MLAALFLTAALGQPAEVPQSAIVDARAAYRSCIADQIATRPHAESADLALAAALARCRDAELALRSAAAAEKDGNAASALAIVLDTRLEGEEEGQRRRDGR